MIVKPVEDTNEYCMLAEPVPGVFASPAWPSAYGKRLKVFGLYREDGKIVGGCFAASTNSFSFSALRNGSMLGSVFCVFDKKSCYYLLGGVNKGSGRQGVNHLLVYRSIEKAAQLGCSISDFEGSMLRGVEKFFRGCGGELKPFTLSTMQCFRWN